MKILKRTQHMNKKTVMNSLRKYFEENLTSYSYLFFSAVVGTAFSAYIKYVVENPKVVTTRAQTNLDIYIAMLYPLLFVVFFLIASLVTFKSPKDIPGKIISYAIHLIFAMFIILASWMQVL